MCSKWSLKALRFKRSNKVIYVSHVYPHTCTYTHKHVNCLYLGNVYAQTAMDASTADAQEHAAYCRRPDGFQVRVCVFVCVCVCVSTYMFPTHSCTLTYSCMTCQKTGKLLGILPKVLWRADQGKPELNPGPFCCKAPTAVELYFYKKTVSSPTAPYPDHLLPQESKSKATWSLPIKSLISNVASADIASRTSHQVGSVAPSLQSAAHKYSATCGHWGIRMEEIPIRMTRSKHKNMIHSICSLF